MKKILVFFILFIIKCLSRIFYSFEVKWLDGEVKDWDDVKIIALLNHTSLFEVLYIGAAPWPLVWAGARKFLIPGADKTLRRPIVGPLFKLISTQMISISRKRDATWSDFLDLIDDKSIVLLAPEGRMMRANGLDAYGKAMSIKGGIIDIISRVKKGKMVIAYSGGLHHVQVPGDRFPRIFKKLKINFQTIDIEEYKNTLTKTEGIDWRDKKRILEDLEERKRKYCPQFSQDELS